MNHKINILIISIYYPPIHSIASNRILSFTKYLDKNIFNIYVLTLDELTNYNKYTYNDICIYRVANNSLLRKANTNIKSNFLFHKAKSLFNIALNNIIKDEYSAWTRNAKLKASEIINKNNINVILSSYAPVASHLVGLYLKRKFNNIKWIADMRDEMSNNAFINHKYKNYLRNIESEIFKHTDAITSVSKPILDNFKHLANNKSIIFKEITNGYDFEIDTIKTRNKVFTISYLGNFYGKRNPDLFLKALEQLYTSKNINDFHIKFIGVNNLFSLNNIIKDNISILPQMSHDDAIAQMKQSDALLLIHPKSKSKGIYTGKLFEYLASLKPIIAIVDKEDVAAKLIVKCGAGYISDSDNIEEIKDIIMLAYNNWKSNINFKPDISVIKKFHRKEQAMVLSKMITNELVIQN
jgi:glycosyltransferase involved in cell wall biosynthesis